MSDWFVTVLISVRDMAAKSGMVALAEEMDTAILVAANESLEKDTTVLENVEAIEHNPGEIGGPPRIGEVRRYH